MTISVRFFWPSTSGFVTTHIGPPRLVAQVPVQYKYKFTLYTATFNLIPCFFFSSLSRNLDNFYFSLCYCYYSRYFFIIPDIYNIFCFLLFVCAPIFCHFHFTCADTRHFLPGIHCFFFFFLFRRTITRPMILSLNKQHNR